MTQDTRLVINAVCSITLIAFTIILIVCSFLYKKSRKAQHKQKTAGQVTDLKDKIANKSMDLRYYFPKANGRDDEWIKSGTNNRLYSLFVFLILGIIAMIALLIWANTGLVLESYQIL